MKLRGYVGVVERCCRRRATIGHDSRWPMNQVRREREEKKETGSASRSKRRDVGQGWCSDSAPSTGDTFCADTFPATITLPSSLSLPSHPLSLSLSLSPCVSPFTLCGVVENRQVRGVSRPSFSTTSVASSFLSFSSFYSRARSFRVTRPRFSPPRSNLGRRFAREFSLPLSFSLNGLLAANMADHRLTRLVGHHCCLGRRRSQRREPS